jgi:hypothetical protein
MSQNSLTLPTTGTLSGLALVEAVNGALDTLNTLASSGSAPASPEAGQLWHDTGNKLLKIRSEDNTSWITLGALDETNYLFSAAEAATATALSGTLGIAGGGTGGTTAATALTNLIGVGSLPAAWSNLLNTNGFRVCPDGFIENWLVTGSIGPGASSTIYWASAFPTACLNICLTPIGTGTTASGGDFEVSNDGTANFTIINTASVARSAFVRALGH